MLGRGEARHIVPNLSQDGRCRGALDAWDLHQTGQQLFVWQKQLVDLAMQPLQFAFQKADVLDTLKFDWDEYLRKVAE